MLYAALYFKTLRRSWCLGPSGGPAVIDEDELQMALGTTEIYLLFTSRRILRYLDGFTYLQECKPLLRGIKMIKMS